MLSFVAVLGAIATTRDLRLNNDWQFHREEVPQPISVLPYRGPNWERVDLPHAAELEDDTKPSVRWFQGVVWYRKSLPFDPSWDRKRVVLKFEGAMQLADIWVNGTHRLTHTGGYLPFELDLSSDARVGRAIEVEVRLDNRDNPNFPPGRPQSALDFTYAGGLYRNVWLEVTETSYIQNVYAWSKSVSHASADVALQVAVAGIASDARVLVKLFDPEGKECGRTATVAAHSSSLSLHLVRPKLWDFDHPHLYRLETWLVARGHVVDRASTRFGIRRLEFDHQMGFRINGRSVKLEGSNRHMAFPIVGNAASDAAQYREARRLKSLGLNILRLAHYPQAPAFLDACDELGILVIDPIPGWQFFRDTPEFKDHVLQDIRETVIRDRNHACVAIFETCLNETYSAPDSFWTRCNQVAHDTIGEGNFFTGGDSYGKHDYSHRLWDVPWTGWDEEAFARPEPFIGQKGLDREYGDYEFGGEESTSRADRASGEGALMLQAWNFIWSHNRNRGNSWSFGDLTWEAIDTFRGMSETSPVSKSGLLDLYRLPKPVAYFYQSQGGKAPMVHIASGWGPRPSPTKVVAFSNCDTVALLVNGREVARQKPDSGPATGYLGPKTADPLYWAHGKGEILPASQISQSVGGTPGTLPFTGGNCDNLSHPPFTFEGVDYRAGRVEAIGYVKGKPVTRDVVLTPGAPARLVLRVDTQGRPLESDGADFVFVYAEVVDGNGQVVSGDSRRIRLTVRGAGRVLGPDIRSAVAGIAPFVVRSSSTAGVMQIEAQADGLGSALVFGHTVRPAR